MTNTKQAEYDSAYKIKAEEMEFVQIRVWVPKKDAEAIKKKYADIRKKEYERFKRNQMHKAMKGKRPAGRPSHQETAAEVAALSEAKTSNK